MKDYATIPNTLGAFPNVVGENASGAGEIDGTAFIKQLVDDYFGARQALMDQAGLTPNNIQESPGASQFVDALDVAIRKTLAVKNWTRINESSTSSDSFQDFAYAHEISGVKEKVWVGVGQQTASTGIWSSRGGNGRWVARANPSLVGFLNGVVWDSTNGLFVAVGNDLGGDAAILTSPEGTNWTERANPKAFDLTDVAENGSGLLVAVGRADGTDAYIVTSPDGITWTERANPKNFGLEAVEWSADLSLFIAIGVSDGVDTYLITSPDGITWTERANPKNLTFKGLTTGNGLIIACNGSDDCMRSSDGIAWTAFSIPDVSGESIQSAIWSEELRTFVLPFVGEISGVTDGGFAIAISPDGITWETIFIGVSAITTGMDFRAIGVGQENLIGGGISGAILYSMNW